MDKTNKLCFENYEHFMYTAMYRIIQEWLKEVNAEEIIAAKSSNMNETLLKMIDNNLSTDGRKTIEKNLSKVNNENRSELTESFYKKLLNVLITFSDFAEDSLEF